MLQRLSHQPQQQRCRCFLFLLAGVLAVAASLPAAYSQADKQDTVISSIPQGLARLTRIDDALDQLLQPIRRLGLPWSDTLTELLRKHLNQNLQVRFMLIVMQTSMGLKDLCQERTHAVAQCRACHMPVNACPANQII
jgi:hypothetical protein